MEEEDEVFVDAEEELETNNHHYKGLGDLNLEDGIGQAQGLDGGTIGLAQGLEEGRRAIDFFFNNNFEAARDIMQRHCEVSIYHALGFGTFNYLKAVLTFEQEYVDLASKVLTQSVATIDTFRKKSGLTDSLSLIAKKKDYNDMTETEVHAELAFAECLLLKAMLTIVEDENLVSFVKAGLKVRQAYLSYKECWTILNKRDWSKDRHKADFEGGVRLGGGTFNLLMSLLPARITKFMEFVGFTGSKDVGMNELLKCYRTPRGMRQFLSCLILLGYHLFVIINMGKPQESDLGLVKTILDDKLSKYPNGAFFLFFKGRYEMVQGRCAEASVWYTKANASQVSWPQFQHVGCWELLWSACIRTQWREAIEQADRLLIESRWSPCLYSYFKAALYSQLPQLTADEQEEQQYLMERVPQLKQRIAGKSLPMEKFAIKKAEKFKAQGYLLLPGLEMVYLWHGFSILSQHFNMVERVHLILQETQAKMKNMCVEDECLMSLLMGMCLKHMGCPLQAEEAFRFVISRGNQIVSDKYLLSYSTVELAILLLDQGDINSASSLLNTAKNYSHYSLQSRLHFKIHAQNNRIKQIQKQDVKTSVPEPTRTISQSSTGLPELISPQDTPSFEPNCVKSRLENGSSKLNKDKYSSSITDFKEIHPIL